MEDLKNHPIGISIYQRIQKEFKKNFSSENLIEEGEFLDENAVNSFLNNLPLRGLVNMSQGKGLSEQRMNQLIFILNRTRKDTFLGKFIGIFKKT